MRDSKMSSLMILLNQYTLEHLIRYSLKVEDVALSLALYLEKFDVLDKYLGEMTPEQKEVALQPLVRKQIIVSAQEDLKNCRFTAHGLKIIKELAEVMYKAEGVTAEELNANLLSHKEAPKNAETLAEKTEFEEFITKFLSFFPEATRGNGGVLLRSNFRDTKDKMYTFMNKYRHDKQTVLEATENYIKKFKGNYSFCTCAMYFIMKHGASILATECDLIKAKAKNQSIGNISNPFEDKM